MFHPYDYDTKTQETMLLGITHYDSLMDWCNGDPERAYHLAKIFYDRGEALEEIISSSAEHSFWYTKCVVNNRFVLGEEVIITRPEYSYWYAKDVLKGRFLLGEETIIAKAKYAYWYAKDVIKGRFVLGEETILNSDFKDRYLRFINL